WRFAGTRRASTVRRSSCTAPRATSRRPSRRATSRRSCPAGAGRRSAAPATRSRERTRARSPRRWTAFFPAPSRPRTRAASAAENACGGRLGALQDADRADAPAAHHVAEAGPRLRELAGARLAAELERRLPDLREAGRPAGMPAGDQAAVGRDRDAAAELEVAALDARLRLAATAEAEQLVVLELL